jgi:YD repeat-containing protein
VTVYTMDSSGRTTGIQLPSSTSGNNIAYSYCDSGCTQYSSYPANAHAGNYVRSVVRDGQLWTYSGGPAQPLSNNNNQGSSTNATYGYTSPVGSSAAAVIGVCEDNNGLFDGPHCMTVGTNPFVQLTDEQGNVFHGPGPLILSESRPEGNTTSYAWDNRSNLTQETLNPKSGSLPGPVLAPVQLSANYDTTCTNPLTCNQPNWIKDGLLNETDYTYDPTHGGVLTATLPADSNGIRPQTRYAYTQRYAWVLNSSGTYVRSATPIWVLATESFCRTSAAVTPPGPPGGGCTHAGDEVVKTYEYGPDSGPNNLFLRGFAVTADGATHRTCYGYDPYGNRISETEANAGLATCP